jgi:hypothetical protein
VTVQTLGEGPSVGLLVGVGLGHAAGVGELLDVGEPLDAGDPDDVGEPVGLFVCCCATTCAVVPEAVDDGDVEDVGDELAVDDGLDEPLGLDDPVGVAEGLVVPDGDPLGELLALPVGDGQAWKIWAGDEGTLTTSTTSANKKVMASNTRAMERDSCMLFPPIVDVVGPGTAPRFREEVPRRHRT